MTKRSLRSSRAREFAVLTAGGASLAVGAIFLAARLFFRNYFILTNRPDPLWLGLVFLLLFALLGILHTLSPAPLIGPVDGGYKEASGG